MGGPGFPGSCRGAVLMSAKASPGEAAVGLLVEFPRGLVGFSAARRFELVELDGLAPFMKLRSLDEAGLGFVVVPPGRYFPDYLVELDQDTAALLGLGRPEDAATLLIVTVPRSVGPPAVNLLGPIVLNPFSGRAAQVVQLGAEYAVSVPLVGS